MNSQSICQNYEAAALTTLVMIVTDISCDCHQKNNRMQGNVSSSIHTGHKNNITVFNNLIDKLRYYCDLILIILPKETIRGVYFRKFNPPIFARLSLPQTKKVKTQ